MAVSGFDRINHIVAVHSAKGGVGKSTLTVNLAAALAQSGARVGVLDADIHGPSLALMLGSSEWPVPVEPEVNRVFPVNAHGLKFISMGNLVTQQTPIIWRGAMVHQMLNQFLTQVEWGDLDFLLIDMPPGTGDAVLTVGQAVPLSGAIIVTTPQDLSLADTVRGVHTLLQLKVPILGIVENMSYFICDGCEDRAFIFGEMGAEVLATELKLSMLGRIPLEAGVTDAGDAGKPLVLAHPDSAAARAFVEIAAIVAGELAKSAKTKGFTLEWEELTFLERQPVPREELPPGTWPIRALWQVSRDELGLKWEDGTISFLSPRELRINCPCAACVDELTGRRTLDPGKVAPDVGITHLETVGRYAIAPHFSDGHNSGIFHFTRLRALADAKTIEPSQSK